MPRQPFETRWIQARELEAAGNIESAIHAYEEILSDEPARLYARLRVSTLLQMQGHYRRARQHAIRAAEDVRVGRWIDLPHVARKLLTFDEQRLMLDLIHGADWSHRDIIAMSPVLAQHLWLAGDVEGAIRMCESALVVAPSHVPLNYAHGIALGYAGRLDEATAAFEKCLALDPGYASAHWSLAYAGRQDEGGTRLPRILGALNAGCDPASAPFLQYAAFKELHDSGRHDAAWPYLAKGAETKRETLDYDAVRERVLVEYLLQREAVPQMDPDQTPSMQAVFVVGMPRTGTTVLDRILGNHPALISGGELTDFRSALNNMLDAFIGPVPTVEAMQAIYRRDIREAGRDYLARTAWRRHGDADVVIDKHPENFFLSDVIMDALPSARILCMRRNPMDSCFSNLKELFANDSYGYSYDLAELADHYANFDRLARHWQATRPRNFLLVDYEALVTGPDVEARRIFDFLGLPFQGEYADITRNTATVTTASASQVRMPVTTRNIGAWRAYAAQLAPLRERLLEMLPASEHARIGHE